LNREQATINRSRAKAREEKTYLGMPCTKGHGGLRYVRSNHCIECIQGKPRLSRAERRARRQAGIARACEVRGHLSEIAPPKPSHPQRGNTWPFGRCFDAENYTMKPMKTMRVPR
jgi:hypothetical protein